MYYFCKKIKQWWCSTMVSLSTVQPSINLVFLSTDKNLKMPLYTLLKVSESTDFQIWKVMHEIIAEWWKESCRTMGLPWYFLRVERPLWYSWYDSGKVVCPYTLWKYRSINIRMKLQKKIHPIVEIKISSKILT